MTWKRRLGKVAITLGALALFLLIRPEYIASAHDHYNRASAPRLMQEYVASHPVRKLQIGSGPNSLPGWLNTDIYPGAGQVYLDATQRISVPDATMHYIFAEHVVEHITYAQGQAMLRECHRVLAPGGRIRLVTPNLSRLVELFTEKKTDQQRWYISIKTAWHEWPATKDPEAYILNMELREWGHLFVYTPKMLSAVLEEAGFHDVKEYKAGETGADPGFQGLEVRAAMNVREVNRYESMAIEAIK